MIFVLTIYDRIFVHGRLCRDLFKVGGVGGYADMGGSMASLYSSLLKTHKLTGNLTEQQIWFTLASLRSQMAGITKTVF